MKYLLIRNKGLAPTDSFRLLGGSTKRDDQQTIGQFGSGTKYVIPSLLRHNIDFHIYAGKNEIPVTTEVLTFKDKVFEEIIIDGRNTSITTDFGGIDWNDPFQWIREFYSNAMDEDTDAIMEVVDTIHPKDGYTSVYIQYTEGIQKVMENIGMYFLKFRGEPLFYTQYGSVYKKVNNAKKINFYRKGIFVQDHYYYSRYDFDSSYIELNEARQSKNTYHDRQVYALAWKSCPNPELILYMLRNMYSDDYDNERSLDWEYTGYGNIPKGEFSDAWKEVVTSNKFYAAEALMMFEKEEVKDRIAIPAILARELISQFGDVDVLGFNANSKSGVDYIEIKPNEDLVNSVIDALHQLKQTRYKHRIIEDTAFKYARFKDKEVMAMAMPHENTIYISERFVDMYSEEQQATLIEEYEHINTNYSDETRNFQQHFINLYLKELKRNSK